MKMIAASAVVILVTAVHAQAQTINDLKKELAEEQAELETISSQIEDAAGPEFSVEKDIGVKITKAPIQDWASRISNPSFQISAQGVSSDGLIYDTPPVWIQPPSDARTTLSFSPLAISLAASGVGLHSTLTANAQVRAYSQVAGVQTNILCVTDPVPVYPVAAQFSVRPGSDMSVAYDINLSEPKDVRLRVRCDLGGLDPIYWPFDLGNQARNIGSGTLNLGYSQRIVMAFPEPLGSKQIDLSTKAAVLAVTDGAISLETDVDLQSAKR